VRCHRADQNFSYPTMSFFLCFICQIRECYLSRFIVIVYCYWSSASSVCVAESLPPACVLSELLCGSNGDNKLVCWLRFVFNPLDSKGNYSATSNNTKFGSLAVDGWAVTFGTARRGLRGLRPRPIPSSLYQM